MTTSNGSPSSHLRNWRPGDDNADELLQQKIADALRDGKSERQIAKLLNIPRTKLWRGKRKWQQSQNRLWTDCSRLALASRRCCGSHDITRPVLPRRSKSSTALIAA